VIGVGAKGLVHTPTSPMGNVRVDAAGGRAAKRREGLSQTA